MSANWEITGTAKVRVYVNASNEEEACERADDVLSYTFAASRSAHIDHVDFSDFEQTDAEPLI